ncbi:Tat proofreading chaperone DmsD [Serratia microhaemolytica]|uniref:Tat proofreading chaperone DmsD n=1 Tax=Serratia microhaemolytica TaxID=2675110 RepID=UPI000FDD37D4|nr:Tat proofreading chaperone DmsD [Serratia microhaemolytica]
MRVDNIALPGRVLGMLLAHAPESEAIQPLLVSLADPHWVSQWPYPVMPATSTLIASGLVYQAEPLAAAYQRLFIGPDALVAPPWGSVYLDRESVLFGDSTLRLRQWLRQHHLQIQQATGEPEDHIGTLLMLAAWLAEQQQQQLVTQLFSDHLLPWAARYFQLLAQGAYHPFYQGVAQLAQRTFAGWKTDGVFGTDNQPVVRLYF